MNHLFAILILVLFFILPSLMALPDRYADSKYYARYGREIAELETKCKGKGVKGKKRTKMLQKIEQLKERCNEWIMKDHDALVREKESLELALASTKDVPEWQKKKLEELTADIARLEAFAEGKDYTPGGPEAGAPGAADGADGAPAPAAPPAPGKGKK